MHVVCHLAYSLGTFGKRNHKTKNCQGRKELQIVKSNPLVLQIRKQATLGDAVTCSKSTSGSAGARTLGSKPPGHCFSYWSVRERQNSLSIHPTICLIHPSTHPSTHSFKKHLTSAPHMPDTVLGLGPQQRTKPAKPQLSGSFLSRE